jgi:hypothetical protein
MCTKKYVGPNRVSVFLHDRKLSGINVPTDFSSLNIGNTQFYKIHFGSRFSKLFNTKGDALYCGLVRGPHVERLQ